MKTSKQYNSPSTSRLVIKVIFPSRRVEGAGIAQWLEHRTRDWKVAGSNPCWNGERIFFSRVDFLFWLLFRYPFHPRVTTVARKKSRSFCQKCRWQVTAKHAYTLRMWILLNCASGIGHNLSLIRQMTSEDIKHQPHHHHQDASAFFFRTQCTCRSNWLMLSGGIPWAGVFDSVVI